MNEDLLVYIARHALIAHLPTALYLGQTCTVFHELLQLIREEAEVRRLRWLPQT